MSNPILSGKYALVRKIASGGMAEVYLAKQLGLQGFEKLVVIKRILPHLSSNQTYVKMFLSEARTAANLHHSNIVHTFEVAEDSGVYYMVMEFLYGQDLRSLIKRLNKKKEKLPLEIAIGLIIEACSGLNYVHTKADLSGKHLGIVHRDVSPHNLIITYDGEIKLVDFGIAKVLENESETHSGVLKGKYAYMSPEQVKGEKLTNKTDLFSLGIILYEISTGERLFKKESQIQTLNSVSLCEIKLPSEINSEYPKCLENIILKSLAKDPESRFENCLEFRSALESCLAELSLSYSPIDCSAYMKGIFCDLIEKDRQNDANMFLGIDTAFWSIDELADNSSEEVTDCKTVVKNIKPKRLWKYYVPVGCMVFLAAIGLSSEYDFSVKSKKLLSKKEERKIVDEVLNRIGYEEIVAFNNKPKKNKATKIQNGFLKIVVNPWANVILDGKSIGITPLSAIALRPGKYKLLLKNPILKKQKLRHIEIKPKQDLLIRESFI